MRNRETKKTVLRILGRTGLVLLTVILIAFGGLCWVCQLVFNGPSESARDVLTMSLLEASATKWVPGVFLGQEKVEEIRKKVSTPLPEDVSNADQIVIADGVISQTSDEWKDYPDGIRIETVYGSTFTAHVMIVRDPSQVYLATSTKEFSLDTEGARLTKFFPGSGALAAINAGAFNDDGTLGTYIGSLPLGLVISEGRVAWDDGSSCQGFVGFNEDNILVVANTMTAQQAMDLNIRDGCCFGPVLLMNGTVNQTEYASNSGYNPRTAIGQRADGAVLLVCIDGRQMGSLGGTYADLINIMVEFGAVNACNLDGGSSSIMLYRDTLGRYGEVNGIVRVNSMSMLQDSSRRMPTFFLVRGPESEG